MRPALVTPRTSSAARLALRERRRTADLGGVLANRDLTEGPVGAHLVRLATPMVLGILAVISVSLADTYFLGQLGKDPLTAISFAFPVVLTISSLAIGLSAGASSVVSRTIGAGDLRDTRRVATDSLILAFLFVLVASVAGWLLARPLFALLGATGDVLDLIVAYMQIWFIGMPFLVVPMVASGLIRANGDSIAPSGIMVFAAIANFAADPLLIFGWGPIPAFGMEGAAWASLFARACTFVAALAIVIVRERLLTVDVPAMAELISSWRRVLSVGVPAAISNMINPLGITVVTAFLAGYSDEVVASFGVATRIESLVGIPLFALSAAIGPIAGQNWGGEATVRVWRALRQSYVFCGLWSGVGAALFLTLAPTLVAPFSDDPDICARAATYLRIVGWTLGGYGVIIVTSAVCNAIDRAVLGLLLTLLRSAVLYVPLVGLAVMLGPPWMAFAGIAVANVLSGGVVAVVSVRVARRPVRPAERGGDRQVNS